jgi:hypothetical protein
VVSENSVVDRNSVKIVDKSSVVVENTWPQAGRVRRKGSSIKCVFPLYLWYGKTAFCTMPLSTKLYLYI